MFFYLKLKKILIKLITFWLPKKYRKNTRNFLFYFSLKNFLKFKKQNYHIIPLGNNCLPRVLMTTINVKPRKIYGEKTYPFDLCEFKDITKIIEIIKNDFNNFFDGLEYKNNKWINECTKSYYPHDNMLKLDEFKKRYKKRIINFQNTLNSNKKIYFVYSNFEKKLLQQDILELFNVLQTKTNNFKLIIISNYQLENIKNKNIIQITENFKIQHNNWVELMINEYKNQNNNYTKFAENIYKKIINYLTC